MRIISGKLKGRRFDLPSSKWKTRPTTDQSKESLFNILANKVSFENLEVLDLFAGTGNIAYEFASRGATAVFCVEKYGAAIRFIKQKAVDFGLESQLNVHKADVFKFLAGHEAKYDLIFADPPYDSPKYPYLIELVFKQNLLQKEGWLIVEHDAKHCFENHHNFVEFRRYGQSFFSFFQNKVNE